MSYYSAPTVLWRNKSKKEYPPPIPNPTSPLQGKKNLFPLSILSGKISVLRRDQGKTPGTDTDTLKPKNPSDGMKRLIKYKREKKLIILSYFKRFHSDMIHTKILPSLHVRGCFPMFKCSDSKSGSSYVPLISQH